MRAHILLILLSIFFLSSGSTAQVMHGKVDHTKVLRFNGHYFSFSRPTALNIMGKAVTSFPSPVEADGERIYRSGYETDSNPEMRQYKSLSAYIKKALTPLLSRLPDGIYLMETYNLVISREGKLIYFDYRDLLYFARDRSGIRSINESGVTMAEMQARLMSVRRTPDPARRPPPAIPKNLQHDINQAMYKALLNAPAFKPAIVNGKKVFCLLGYDDEFRDLITVTDHVVTFQR